MPKNKNAFFRYRIIDRCLRDQNHQWSKKGILEQVNKEIRLKFGDEYTVSIAMIRHDLDAIDIDFNAPLIRYPQKRPRFYKYDDPSFSIFEQPISPKDQVKLQKVVSMLGSIKGLDLAEEVEPIMLYLQNRSLLRGLDKKRVLLLDHRPISSGSEFIEDFLSSIMQKTVLEFEYKPFLEKEGFKVVLSPYLIKEYNNRWYCIGYCSIQSKIMHIGFDRIDSKLKISRTVFVENSFIDIDTYFDDIIGITKTEGMKKQLVRISCNKERAPFILTKPLHHSQKLINLNKDGSAEIEIHVIPNKEMYSLLLSFGKDIQVLSPDFVRRELKQEFKNAYSLY